MKRKAEPCQLKVEPFFQCCCNCQHHWQDFHHCTIHTDKRTKANACVCSKPKGWVCVGFRFQGDGSTRVHSEWPEHSVGCEMYAPIVPLLKASEGK